MPFVQGTCPNCGGTLAVDNEKEAWVCLYCNTPFIVEKAINNFNITNNIRTNTVNIYSNTEKDFEIVGGVLKKYKGEATEVRVPDNVKVIGYRAFANCIAINSIILPNSLIKIENYAFSRCTSIESIVIPENVKEIAQNAFEYCSSLKEITLPLSLEELGVGVFQMCESLKSLVIPDNVKSIRQRLCSCCKNLESITIGSNTNFSFYGEVGYSDFPFSDCQNLLNINYEHLHKNLDYFPAYSKWFKEERDKIRKERRINNVCVYCGGNFKGIFNKVCSVCGKKKNY